jgi:serine/threonine protein kinase
MSLHNRLGQYAVAGMLGSGAMGEVYRATDSRMFGRPVAIKVLSDRLSRKQYARSRFKREVEVAAKLNHPNIVTIHDRGECDGRPFLVMEYLDGVNLCRMVRNHEATPIQDRIRIACQICDALEFAHENHVVHRDVKPANIVVVPRGDQPLVKLVDFGIVHIEHSDLTRAVTQPGTFSYMSPEQLRREEFDHRSDLFSLGIVLYELFTGKHPFEAASEPLVVNRILEDEPLSARSVQPDLPEGLNLIIMKLMEKNPEQRPRNAGKAAAALQLILQKQPADSTVESEDDLTTLLDINERFVERFLAFGRKKESEGEFQEALNAYRKAWTLNPEHESVRAMQLLFDDDGRAREEDPARERFVKTRIRVAEKALGQGNATESRRALEEIIERYQDEPLARLMMERSRVIQASGVDYRDYRVALRAAEQAMDGARFLEARENCTKGGEVWPEDGEWKSLERKILDRLQSEIARCFTRAERLLQEAERKVSQEEESLECVENALSAMCEADSLGSEKKWTRPTVEEATRLKHDLLHSLASRRVRDEAARRSARRRVEEALEAGREFLMRAEESDSKGARKTEATLRLYEQAQESFGKVLDEQPDLSEAMDGRNKTGKEIERLVGMVEEQQEQTQLIQERLENARSMFGQAEEISSGDLETLRQCMAILTTGRHEINAALAVDSEHREAREMNESFEEIQRAVERRQGRLVRQQAAIIEAMKEGEELLLEGSLLASGGLDEMRNGEKSCRAAERAFTWILSQEENHPAAQDCNETLRTLLEHLQSEIERRERGLDPPAAAR